MCRKGGKRRIFRALQRTPRCGLEGHGFFKGDLKDRKIPGKEKRKRGGSKGRLLGVLSIVAK